jgi:hypothetical protein
MTKSVIDLSTEKIYEPVAGTFGTLYSSTFTLSDEDLPVSYGHIASRMKEALKAHNRHYQWIVIPEEKVVYSKT